MKKSEDILKQLKELEDKLYRHEDALNRVYARWNTLPWYKKVLRYLGFK